MNSEMLEIFEKEKIVVIVRGVESKKLIPLAEAMYKGGIRFLEITYSADASVSDEETAANIKMLSEHFDEKMYIGAGTVLNTDQVEKTKAAGGRFIISPDTNPEVIIRTKELGMVSMPGALTPTEAQIAHRSGADYVKLFPISNLGIDYFKAVKAPLSHIKFLAVGGVNENNIADYISAGICGFGIGSNIIPKQALLTENYDEITELAKKYVAAVKK